MAKAMSSHLMKTNIKTEILKKMGLSYILVHLKKSGPGLYKHHIKGAVSATPLFLFTSGDVVN